MVSIGVGPLEHPVVVHECVQERERQKKSEGKLFFLFPGREVHHDSHCVDGSFDTLERPVVAVW